MDWWPKRKSKTAVPRPVLTSDNSKEPPCMIDGTTIWLKNTSPYPLDRVQLLLSFAFAAVKDYGIEIHVKGSNSVYKGRAYNGVPKMANVVNGANYLVTIGLTRARSRLPQNVAPRTRRQLKLYPDGIQVRSWEDVLVFVAAHEARHIWQFQSRRNSGQQPISEVDAEEFAIQRLNDWRVKTGDLAVPPVF